MAVWPIPKKSILLLFLCCELIGSKKILSQDLNNLSSKKLGDCKRCRILTDSFNYWLDKTSRGKYEGGDAAWEEAKLKSYARSEIRLVEIQEGLCSEVRVHQDQCYALSEEVEQVLEKWWFQEDTNLVDLYTWLCIENLQYCCPDWHFGAACMPCLKDKDNKVCSGHGKCDGDGTRKGNGTCICKKGYSGVLCDECSKNFYLLNGGLCYSCHKSCDGCTSEGAHSCEACNPGWELKSGECVDVNECSSSVCEDNEYCTNTKGSYNCEACDETCKTCTGEGPTSCTSCESPSVLWVNTCIDDEQKQDIIVNTLKRIALYIGFLAITLFKFRTSRTVASIVVLCVAIFYYFFEKKLKYNTIDVVLELALSSN